MRSAILLVSLLLAAPAYAQYPGSWGYQPVYPAYPAYPGYPPPPPGYAYRPAMPPPPTQAPMPYPGQPRQDQRLASMPSTAMRPNAMPPGAMRQAMLRAHNAVRARVGVSPLHWSDALARVAQQWADHLAATNGFYHRPDNRYGENLYMMTGGSASPAQVVGMWADEARQYDIRTNACAGECGHYTQLVWSTTRAVGCAAAANAYRQIWVCEYDPKGNWVGYPPYGRAALP